jgi:hypothetical protein
MDERTAEQDSERRVGSISELSVAVFQKPKALNQISLASAAFAYVQNLSKIDRQARDSVQPSTIRNDRR